MGRGELNYPPVIVRPAPRHQNGLIGIVFRQRIIRKPFQLVLV